MSNEYLLPDGRVAVLGDTGATYLAKGTEAHTAAMMRGVGEYQVFLDQWRARCVVSSLQARAAMMDAGILSEVEAAVGDADVITQLAWAEATEWPRSSPIIATLSQAMGMNDKQIDALFRAAEDI